MITRRAMLSAPAAVLPAIPYVSEIAPLWRQYRQLVRATEAAPSADFEVAMEQQRAALQALMMTRPTSLADLAIQVEASSFDPQSAYHGFTLQARVRQIVEA